MENNALIDALPLWGLFIAILGVVLISVECGYRLGKFRLSRREQEKEAPVGTMVGATLGLLAFILAFTFGLASSRFDNRRQLLLDEANALGTTYLRAGMLPEWGEEVRRLLRDYIGHRLDAVRSGDVTEGIRRSENIQQQVWTEAETVAQKNLNSIVVGLFSFRSRWCYCAKIITAVAVAFLLVVSCFHLPVARGPGRDRLRQARHRAAAAAAAAASGAVVAEAADHKRPAFFLFGRAPHPWLRHQEAA
jgi:hypothetical protein